MVSRRLRDIFIFLLMGTMAAGQQTAAKHPAPHVAVPAAAAPETAEQRTAEYLDSIRKQPSLLLEFVQRLPKGGDLHNHLIGAAYAENLIAYAAQDHLCLERQTLQVIPADGEPQPSRPAPFCDEGKGHVAAARAFTDPVLYRDVLDTWSMRHFSGANGESGHDHFFATFIKFWPATYDHLGDILAETVSRAGREHLSYVEFIHGIDNGAAARLGAGMGWSGDVAAQREKLLAKDVGGVVARARATLDQGEANMRSLLRCGAANPDPGCGVTVRYIYEVHRGLPPDQVFAEMITGFELAAVDPRVVGINLVMPEDSYVPMHDFALHMRMMDALHKLYPKVHISLHAGELAPGLVPPEGLQFHIRDSIETGHAERIGHGVDVMYERDPIGLLREMASRNVLVEICITSNDTILGVQGPAHPLSMYLKYGVPVALATDDEGVSRSDMNQEYLRAIETYQLSYPVLKRMVRNSLEHAFIGGASLWSDANLSRRAACQGDRPGAPQGSLSKSCRDFLQGSARGRLQWKLEGEFADFEAAFPRRGDH